MLCESNSMMFLHYIFSVLQDESFHLKAFSFYILNTLILSNHCSNGTHSRCLTFIVAILEENCYSNIISLRLIFGTGSIRRVLKIHKLPRNIVYHIGTDLYLINFTDISYYWRYSCAGAIGLLIVIVFILSIVIYCNRRHVNKNMEHIRKRLNEHVSARVIAKVRSTKV